MNTQKEYTLKEYTQKEYEADMLKLLREKGLKEAVREQLDKIIEDSAGLPYIPNMGIRESANDILYLCELQEDIIAKLMEAKMRKESEINKTYAEKLAKLIADHPDLRVIAWIDTDGLSDDYCCVAGNLNEPCIETLIVGKDNMYHSKEDSPYDDCFNYYGCECDDWTDEKLEEKAKAIPWEDVIAVRVGVN